MAFTIWIQSAVCILRPFCKLITRNLEPTKIRIWLIKLMEEKSIHPKSNNKKFLLEKDIAIYENVECNSYFLE